jgi:septal ring factor EnvC (AmiA/AmiB activator)
LEGGHRGGCLNGRLELARRDTPRIDEARRTLIDQQRAARDEIRDVDQATERAQEAVNVQSYVRGRIALYLDSSTDTGDDELERLRRDVARAEEAVATLAEALDVDAGRSRTTSLLRTVSRQMTAWAQQLDLRRRHPQRTGLHGRWRHRQRPELGRLPPHRLPGLPARFHRAPASGLIADRSTS